MATQTIEKLALAFAHLAVIKQATTNTEILDLCKDASDLIAEDGIVITDGVDPAAELQTISFQPFYAAIDECNRIADASSSTAVKESCLTIAQKLTNLIHQLI
ncbi:hypothetical protein BH11BAC1_BH11BAC1_24660 [soil metagenome]